MWLLLYIMGLSFDSDPDVRACQRQFQLACVQLACTWKA